MSLILDIKEISQSRWDWEIKPREANLTHFNQNQFIYSDLSKPCSREKYRPSEQAIVWGHLSYRIHFIPLPTNGGQRPAKVSMESPYRHLLHSLGIETQMFSVLVSSLRLRHFQYWSQSCHWYSQLFSLGLFIETQTFSVSVLSLRLRHFQSRSRSRWSKYGLANPCLTYMT